MGSECTGTLHAKRKSTVNRHIRKKRAHSPRRQLCTRQGLRFGLWLLLMMACFGELGGGSHVDGSLQWVHGYEDIWIM